MERNKIDIANPNYDAVYHSKNYGDFKVIEIIDHKKNHGMEKIKIKFIATGSEKIVYAGQARAGHVKDDYLPVGIGGSYMGTITDPPEVYGRDYDRWKAMLKRCYSPINPGYKDYGAKGVTVCDRWKGFEYYYEDIKYLPNYDKYIENPNHWFMDKDILQADKPKNERYYGPDTCMYVDRITNGLQANYEETSRKCTSKYPGVYKHGDLYRANTRENGKYFLIGQYYDEDMAAAAYRNFMSIYHPEVIIPGPIPPYYPPQVLRDMDRARCRVMCRIVDKEDQIQAIAAREYITPFEILKPFIQYQPLKEMCHIVQK